MSVGLDTTVVLRLIVGEPAAQAAAARQQLEEAFRLGQPIHVCDLVVAEAYHALHYHYGVGKSGARDLLRAMLSSGVVELEPSASLDALDPARSPGLVDRLIAARYRGLGDTTLTFDRRLGRLDGVEVLSARRKRG